MRRPPYALFAAVAVAFGVAALALAPPVPGFGDDPEFVLVLARNGVAHPTGYPLYTILGHATVVLFHALGLGWARAAAAWSALGGAVAVFFFALLAWRWAAPDDGPGAGASAAAGARGPVVLACLAAALLLAGDGIWLAQATTAEVHTWHIAWACAAAWCALEATRRAARAPGEGGEGGDARSAALLGFVLGIGLAHHRTAVFLATPLAFAFFVATWRARGPKAAHVALLVGAAAAAVPLSSYAWIAWRAFHPGPAQWPALDATWASVWDHVGGGQYRGFLGRFAPDADSRAALARFGYPLLAPGLALLAVLGVRGARRGDLATPALAAGAWLTTAWAFGYGVPDPEPYFLLPLALGLAAIAPAVQWAAAARARPKRGRARAQLPRAGVIAALVALGVGLVAWGAFGVRSVLATRAATEQGDRVVRLMWQSLPADSSLVFWPADAHQRLLAYQQLDGEKTSLYVMTPAFLGFPPVRRAFAARFGFDPMEGFSYRPLRSGSPDEAHELELLYRALLLHVSARTPLAVYIMVPEQGVLRIVPKDRDASPARP